jgi:hypothetical protein
MADVGGPINNLEKIYNETVPCGSSASQVMGAVENNFPLFGNYSRDGGAEKLTFSPRANMGPGSTIPIQASVVGYHENLTVNVQSMNSQSMTFTTTPGHLIYPGWITFSASTALPGSINFNIHLGGTVAQPKRFKYFGDEFENAQWMNFLAQVRTFCNGGAK